MLKKSTVQVGVEINGKKAGATFIKLINEVETLEQSIKNLTPGQEKYNAKLKELNALNEQLKLVKPTYSMLKAQQRNLLASITKLNKEDKDYIKNKEMLEKKLGKVELKLKSTNKTYGELKGSVIGLKKQLNQLEPGSAKFIETLKKLDGARSELNKADKQINQISNSLKKGEQNGNLLRKGLKLLGPVIVATFSIAAIKSFFSNIFDGVQKLALINTKFNQVFGEASSVVEASAEMMSTSIGLTRNQYKGLATDIGDLLVPMGFQRAESAKLSTDLVNLSGALSAWTGGQKTSKDVSDILAKALLGEREQLKTLGISIKEADIKSALLAKGWSKLTGKALEQAKAMVTLELITNKSKDAQESFKKNSEDLIQTKARVSAQIKNVGESLSKYFLPLFQKGFLLIEKFIGGLISFGLALAAIPKFIKENRVTILALLTALTALNYQLLLSEGRTLALAAAQKGQAIITKGLAIAQRALNLVMKANPIGLVVTAISLLIAGLSIAYKKSEKFRAVMDGLKEVGITFFNVFKDGLKAFADGWDAIKKGHFVEGMKKIGEGLVKTNPIGIAFAEGKKLGDAYNNGYAVSLEKTRLNEEEAFAKKAAKLQEKGKEAGENTGQAIIDGINKKLDENAVNVSDVSTKTKKAKSTPVTATTSTDKGSELGPFTFVKLQVDNVKKYIADQFKLVEDAGGEKLDELEKQFLEGALVEEAYQEEKLLQQESNLQAELDLMRQFGAEETKEFRKKELEKLKVQKQLSDQRQAQAKREADIKRALIEMGKDTLKQSLQFGIELLSKDEKAKKKYGSKIKALQIGLVAINVATEISGIWKNANLNHLNSLIPGWGIAFASIQTGLALGRAALQTSKIANTKLYTGGYTGPGGKYEPAGIVHKGEYVLNQEDVNIMGGARGVELWKNLITNRVQKGYAAGGYVADSPTVDNFSYEYLTNLVMRGYADGGIVTNVDTTPVGVSDVPLQNGGAIDLSSLTAKLDEIISINSHWPTMLKAYVAVDEFEAVQADINESKELASI